MVLALSSLSAILTIISHRNLGYICDPNPTLVFWFVEPRPLSDFNSSTAYMFKKNPFYFKAVRKPPPQNNTFTKTTTVLEFPLYFRQVNIWSLKFTWISRLSLKQVKTQNLKDILRVPLGCSSRLTGKRK